MKKVAPKAATKAVKAAIVQKAKPTKTQLKQGAMVEKAEKPNESVEVMITFSLPKSVFKNLDLKGFDLK